MINTFFQQIFIGHLTCARDFFGARDIEIDKNSSIKPNPSENVHQQTIFYMVLYTSIFRASKGYSGNTLEGQSKPSLGIPKQVSER